MIHNIKSLLVYAFISTMTLTYSYGQDTLIFKTYKSNDINWLSIINQKIFISKGAVIPKKNYVFVDNQPVDNSGVGQSPFVLFNKKVYFVSYDLKSKTKKLSLINGTVAQPQIPFTESSYLVLGPGFGFDGERENIYSFNFSGGKKQIVLDSNQLEGLELVSSIIINDKLYCTYGFPEQGYTDFKYVLVKPGSIIYLDAEEKFHSPTFLLEMVFEDKVTGLFYAKSTRYKENPISTLVNDLLLDKNLNVVTTMLKKTNLQPSSVLGWNYVNDTLHSYNIRSLLDDSSEVSLAYRFNPQLEVLMRDAFNDSLLLSDDLKKINFYELKCLVNLIYAKHNYAFKEKYFQAYFNLFTFYSKKEKKQNRKADVEVLFTPRDKKNIKLILTFLDKQSKNYSVFKIE